jgi:hypothetical protein
MPRLDPFISIVVPIRNEEATIERLARSLLDQDYPHDRYEILMADGGSTDRTRELLAMVDPGGRIVVLDNPGRTAPAALNVAISKAKGDIVTRVDGHGHVAPDYLSRIVAVMEETGESVVGGPVQMHADTPFRRALVEALYSKIAVGAVPYRTLKARAYVESLQTGSFRKAVLDRVGPFDESLAVVEDLDMNTRIRKARLPAPSRPVDPFLVPPAAFAPGAVAADLHGRSRQGTHPPQAPRHLQMEIRRAHRVRRGRRRRGGRRAVREADRARRPPPLSWNRPGVRALSRAASRPFGRTARTDPARPPHRLRARLSLGRDREDAGTNVAPSGRAVSDRHEARVLLAILSRRWEAVEALASSRPVDAGRFVGLCKAADVAPTVHAALAAAGRAGLLGDEVAGSLSSLRAKTRVDNLLLLKRLDDALDLLLQAGIRPVALKGVDVLNRLYGSFDERSLDDVDLLVPAHQRDRAIEALERAGFTAPTGAERTHWLRSSFEMPMTSPGPVGVAFEIHWSLGQSKRYRIDGAELIARAVPFEIDGRSILRLDEHDAVAHLLLHHVQHYFDRRLKWVLEIGLRAGTPGFSWPVVARRLAEWNGRPQRASRWRTSAGSSPSCCPEPPTKRCRRPPGGSSPRCRCGRPIRSTSTGARAAVSSSWRSRPRRSSGRGTCRGT